MLGPIRRSVRFGVGLLHVLAAFDGKEGNPAYMNLGLVFAVLTVIAYWRWGI